MHRSRKDASMLLNLYNDIKDCVPLEETYLSNYIDWGVVKAIKKIDQIVVVAKGFQKTIGKSMPKCQRVREKVYGNVRKRLREVNERLGMFIWCFQKERNREREEKDESGLSLLQLSIEIIKKYGRLSFLIGKESLVKLKSYLSEPNSFLLDLKDLYQQIQIRSLALHKTISIFTSQLLKYLGNFLHLKYCSIRRQIRLTFFHLKHKKYILKSLLSKFQNGIKITIKQIKKGFILIFHRDQYAQNQSNFISSLVQMVGKMIRRAQKRWSTGVEGSKQIYENIIKNYKMQKLLIRNERMKSIEKQKIKSKTKAVSFRASRNPSIENQEDQYLTQLIQKVNQEKDYK